MAVVLGTFTYKDFANQSKSFKCYIDTGVTPNQIVSPVLFDHLGNTLSIDIGGGVGALKITSMTAEQAIGLTAHDGAITDADEYPLLLGAAARATEPAAVSAANDKAKLWADMIGRLIMRIDHQAEDQLATTPKALANDTGSHELFAAQAAGVKIALKGGIVSNAHATLFSHLLILDNVTEVGRIPIPPLGGAVIPYFGGSIKGSAATAMNYQLTTALGATTAYFTPIAYKTKV